jgi:hypothetical protein
MLTYVLILTVLNTSLLLKLVLDNPESRAEMADDLKSYGIFAALLGAGYLVYLIAAG